MKFLNKKMMIVFVCMTSFISSSFANEYLEATDISEPNKSLSEVNKDKAKQLASTCTEDNISFELGSMSPSMEKCARFIQTEDDVKNWIEKGTIDWQSKINKRFPCCLARAFDKGEEKPIVSCHAEFQQLIPKCIAVGHVLSKYDRKWSPEDREEVQKVSSKNTQQGTGTMVAGSNISCESQGVETVDYEACKKFVDAYTAAEAATQMVHAGQSVMLQGKLMDVEADMIKDQNTATGALKAQAKGMKEQANIYAQRAALDASKLGILYNLYSAIPQSKDLKKACHENYPKVQELQVNGVSFDDAYKKKLSAEGCEEAVNVSLGRFSLLKNQAALDAMKAQLMTAAVSTANNTILSKLTNDRAKEAKRAIADIEDFKPTDPFKIATEEEKTTLCEKDPSSKQCTDIGLDANYDAVSDNTIVFGSTGSGSSYTGGSASENEIANGSDGTSSSGGSVPTIGSVIAEVDKSGSVESSAAGTVSSKANGGSASGGGGPGGGAGSLGGQTPQKAAEGGVAQAIASKVAAYSGGEGFSVTGGLGIKGKKSGEKSEENPFGKLFGKDGAKASDVNFRDIASTKVGAKGDNIFDMISKRYGAVNSEKRLVEYELAR